MTDKKLIPTNEMRFFNEVSIDEVGEVFEWHGGIFRGVTKEACSLVNKYFSSGFLDEIVGKGFFPKTQKSTYTNPRYCYILEHERIELQSIDAEWSFDMLKDAAILVCKLADIAWRYGFNMKDCHTKNVLFRNNKPIYVDLGSFIEREESTNGYRSYEQLLSYYYYVLILWSDGCHSLPKQLQALYKFERYDYLLYKYPLWRHFNRLLVAYDKLESNLIKMTFKPQTTDILEKSEILYIIWRLLNSVSLFKWQKPWTFAKMFVKLKTPKHLRKTRIYGDTFVFSEDFLEELNSPQIIIINPHSYNFLDGYVKVYDKAEIVTIDVNEREGNANYLKYKDGDYKITNLSFNLFYPNLHYNYQTPPHHRLMADTFVLINPYEVAKDVNKPIPVLYKLLLKYSFSKLIIIDKIDNSHDVITDENILECFCKEKIINNKMFCLTKYIKKDDKTIDK